MTETRLTTLANGLRVAVDPMPDAASVSLGIWVGSGSRHEAKPHNGMAHLMEHMAFKGTRHRSAFRIVEEIESVGGQINAYTGRERTAYYARVLRPNLPRALDVLTDMVRNPVLDAMELDREQGVVCQEIAQAHDTPDDIVFDHFQETAFPDQGLGRPVLGSEASVRALSRDTLQDFVTRDYVPSRMVVAAAGAVDPEAFTSMVAAALGDAADAETPATPEPALYSGGCHVEARDLEQVHLVLGFAGTPLDHPDQEAAQVLATLLGGGMSSRLFQEIRENRGLAYSVYAFANPHSDSGTFGVYAGTGAEDLDTLIPVLCDELCKASHAVTDEEVERAKAQVRAAMLMGRESVANRCEHLARQVQTFGRALTTQELLARLDAVDVRAVLRVAKETFGTTPTIAAVGPVAGLEAYDKITSRLGVAV